MQLNELQLKKLLHPPGPRGYPLIGVLPKLRKDPLGLFLNLSQSYDAPLIRLGGERHGLRWYLLNHPDALSHVLVSNARNYRRGLNIETVGRAIMGNGLVMNEGASWLHQRRLLQPAFHRRELPRLAEIMVESTEAMLESWGQSPSATFDMATAMEELTQRVALRTLFGVGHDVDDQTAMVLRNALRVVIAYLNQLITLPLPLWVPTAGNREFKQAIAELDQLVYGIIREHRGVDGAGPRGERALLLDLLLSARDEESGEGMDDRQVRDELMTMFMAGQETNTKALSWTWHLLVEHPDAMDRMRDELERVLGGRPPRFEDLSQLSYTKMVFDEALRLYPPPWLVTRSAIADDEIMGYHIPAGALVMISPYSIHHHPAFWDEPERFDPERFTRARAAGRHRLAYLPFGSGPRQCIGEGFAIMEAQIVLAMVAQRYTLQPGPAYHVEPEAGTLLRPRHGVELDRRARVFPTQATA